VSKVRQTIEGKTNLFLFPHNDDELFALPILQMAEESSKQSICIFLTSPQSRTLAQKRRSESDVVLSGLNKVSLLNDGSINSLDGFLVTDLAHLRRLILKYIAENGIILDNCVFPALEGGHQDHDAAHLLGASLSLSLELKSLQYLTYRPIGWYKFYTAMSPSKMFRDTQEIEKVCFSVRAGFKFISKVKHYPTQKKSLILLFPFMLLRYLIHRRIEVVISKPILQVVNHKVVPLYNRRNNFNEVDFLNESRKFFREINPKDYD